MKAFLPVGGAIGSVEQRDVRAIDATHLPRRLALRRFGGNKTEVLQGELGPYVLAALIAQMGGEAPGFGAHVPVTAVIPWKHPDAKGRSAGRNSHPSIRQAPQPNRARPLTGEFGQGNPNG